MANAPVTGVATIAAQHLPQAALRHHHALARRLFEQAPGQVLDLGFVAQARAVEQPQGNFQGKAFGGASMHRGLARCLPRNFMTNRFGDSKGAPLYSFFRHGPVDFWRIEKF
jgi:hypothetical protein